MPGNVKRAIGIAVQAAQGTPATTPFWLRYIESHSWEPNLEFDVPKYERGVRAMEGDAIPTTRHTSLDLHGRVDSREFGRLCTAFAAYSFASGTHTLDFAGTGLKFLTVWIWDYVTAEMFRIIDVRGDKLNLMLDYAGGTYKFDATLLGLGVTVLTSSLPVPSYAAYTGRDPLAPWQTPTLLNASAYCLINAKLALDNHLEPLYCSPTTDPTGSTPPGLEPSEIQEGWAGGTYDFEARYTGDAGSPFHDYQANLDEAWVIKSTYPLGTPHVLTLTLPRAHGTKGKLDEDPSKINLRQNVSGIFLLDDATATHAKLTIAGNGIGDYTA